MTAFREMRNHRGHRPPRQELSHEEMFAPDIEETPMVQVDILPNARKSTVNMMHSRINVVCQEKKISCDYARDLMTWGLTYYMERCDFIPVGMTFLKDVNFPNVLEGGDCRRLVTIIDFFEKYNRETVQIVMNDSIREQVNQVLDCSALDGVENEHIGIVVETTDGPMVVGKDIVRRISLKLGLFIDLRDDRVLRTSEDERFDALKKVLVEFVNFERTKNFNFEIVERDPIYVSNKVDGEACWVLLSQAGCISMNVRGLIEDLGIHAVDKTVMMCEKLGSHFVVLDMVVWHGKDLRNEVFSSRIKRCSDIVKTWPIFRAQQYTRCMDVLSSRPEELERSPDGIVFTPDSLYGHSYYKIKQRYTVDLLMLWRKDSYVTELDGREFFTHIHYRGNRIVGEFRVVYRQVNIDLVFFRRRDDRVVGNSMDVIQMNLFLAKFDFDALWIQAALQYHVFYRDKLDSLDVLQHESIYKNPYMLRFLFVLFRWKRGASYDELAVVREMPLTDKALYDLVRSMINLTNAEKAQFPRKNVRLK